MKILNFNRFLLVLSLIFILQVSAQAQFKARNRLILFNGSLGLVKSDETGNKFSSYMFSFYYEQIMINTRTVWGVSIGYLNGQDKADTPESRKVNFQTIPFMFYAKHLFGSGRVRGYAKGGLGLHSSKIEFVGPETLVTDWDAGLLLGAGAGIYVALDENIFINLNYDFTWLDNSYYQDGLAHFFNLGLGFHLN